MQGAAQTASSRRFSGGILNSVRRSSGMMRTLRESREVDEYAVEMDEGRKYALLVVAVRRDRHSAGDEEAEEGKDRDA